MQCPDTIRFTVPGPPVPLARPRTVRRHGIVMTYTPSNSRRYESSIKAHCLAAKGRRDWALDGEYALRCTIVFGDRRRRDLDNVIKSVADSLIGVVYADDSQIVELVATREIDRDRPRVEVEVERKS
jgi:Holliday junction resolvase RusA-like endonuclease